MRFMTRLPVAIYLYMGIFFALCLLCWIVTGEEPAALIAGISAAAGVESIIAGCMRIREIQEERKRESEGKKTPEMPGGKIDIEPAWGEK
ncbi:MAG: hypothetical protein IJX14_12655 [Clostridia bacterium]|nr:hypothetical protein [Clostridia bacterium]